MATNLKALLVLLMLALVVFRAAKPICLRYISETDYDRRRNIWLTLTVIAFITPSFWLYVLIAFPLIYKAGKKDNNPVALYLMLLHVIPPYSVAIPGVFFSGVFDLNNFRLLAMALLMPATWKIIQEPDNAKSAKLNTAEKFLLAYLALDLVTLMPYESATNTVRRAVLMAIDAVVILYAVSRICNDRRRLTECIVVFILSSAILAPVAICEAFKSWLIYDGLGSIWGIPLIDSYLFRAGTLRAQVSTGHSLILGYLLAMGFVFWLFLSTNMISRYGKFVGSFGLWGGLIAAYSRAPWIAAILGYVTFQLMIAGGFRTLLKVIIAGVPAVGLLLMTPIGQRIFDALPFIGTVDASNVDYRQNLAAASWQRISEYPFFGDPLFLTHLENMRQGQGIIDLVNVYASIAMLHGGVGLLLFLMPLILAALSTFRRIRNNKTVDTEFANIGAAIFSCILATSFFMATASFYLGLTVMYYILIAMGVAYGKTLNTSTALRD